MNDSGQLPNMPQASTIVAEGQSVAALSDAEMRMRLEEYDILFNTMPIMLWYKDTENRTLRVNRAAAAFENLPPEALEGKSAYDIYPKEQAEAFHADDLEVIRSGQPKLEIVEQHSNPVTGEVQWVQTGKVPFRDRTGKIIGVIAFATDITHQKQAEVALKEAHTKLADQHRKMARVHEFFRSTLDLILMAVQRGASRNEMNNYVKDAMHEFGKLDAGH